jgi:flagellar biosynthesis protein FlhB
VVIVVDVVVVVVDVVAKRFSFLAGIEMDL